MRSIGSSAWGPPFRSGVQNGRPEKSRSRLRDGSQSGEIALRCAIEGAVWARGGADRGAVNAWLRIEWRIAPRSSAGSRCVFWLRFRREVSVAESESREPSVTKLRLCKNSDAKCPSRKRIRLHHPSLSCVASRSRASPRGSFLLLRILTLATIVQLVRGPRVAGHRLRPAPASPWARGAHDVRAIESQLVGREVA
jgi:hypothetical protein